MPSVDDHALKHKLLDLVLHLGRGLFEREEAVRLCLLSSLARESVFLLGPPGTAKSLIARRVKFAFEEARAFEYLMGKFSTPEEVFGPISVKRLRDDDRYERLTENYLPEAEIVFLDEIWKASSPIQNALLTALNERLFRNGQTEVRIPLRCVVAASNELPEAQDATAAFWDRFLLRLKLGPIADASGFAAMMRDPVDPYEDPVPAELKLTNNDVAGLEARIAEARIPDSILEVIIGIRNELTRRADAGEAGFVSDRRWRKIARLLRTSAVANGRDCVDIIDCGIIPHCVWDSEAHIEVARRVVADTVKKLGPRAVVGVEELEERLADLSTAIDAATLTTKETHGPEPVLHFGEYYKVEEYDPEATAYIWRTDFESLPGDADETAEVDLFFYDVDGKYLRTIRADAAHSSRGAVEIDGRIYALDTQESAKQVEVRHEPAQADKQTWRDAVDTIKSATEAAIERGEAFCASAEGDARTHLFVPQSFGAIVAQGIEEAVNDAADIHVRATELARKAGVGAPL